MLYALESDINNIGTINSLFPNISFPEAGPSAEFLADNHVLPVSNQLNYDPSTQALEESAPYVLDGTVYTVQVRELTPEEIQARKDAVKAQNKSIASGLLAATDWTEIPAVTDTSKEVYLTNKAEFDIYRTALRAIAVNPPETSIAPQDWPVKPTEAWHTVEPVVTPTPVVTPVVEPTPLIVETTSNLVSEVSEEVSTVTPLSETNNETVVQDVSSVTEPELTSSTSTGNPTIPDETPTIPDVLPTIPDEIPATPDVLPTIPDENP